MKTNASTKVINHTSDNQKKSKIPSIIYFIQDVSKSYYTEVNM